MIWKKCLISAALILSFTGLNCGTPPEYVPPPKKITEKEKILRAFIAVESSGDRFAYNKIEKAAGILQIRPIRLDEINRLFGTSYKLEDRFDSIKSVEMFLKFQLHYDPDLNLEEVSKNWQGNPNWKSTKYTAKYYAKIKQAYACIE